MLTFRLTLLAPGAVVAWLMAGCATVAPDNPRLNQARIDYSAAQNTVRTRELAAAELRQAGDALARAEAAWSRREDPAEVDHLAYLATQRTAIATEAGRRAGAEQTIDSAKTLRDRLRQNARTMEANAALRSAEAAQRQTEAAQRQAQEAQARAQASQQQADAAQRQASDALARTGPFETMLKELNAKRTERGLVVTIGDMLFDADKAQLTPGGLRSVDKLADLLTQYPRRRARVEGFTDSAGSPGDNLDLSGRRANAVRAALVAKGVDGDRITAGGFGQAFPMAGNDSAEGRQLNRRVEIILSDDSGTILAR